MLLGTRSPYPPATFQTPATLAKHQSTLGGATSRASANELIELQAGTALG